jgi:hypothetical protein
MTMPFGKYRGVEVQDLPDSYICWLVDEVDLFGQLRLDVHREYFHRLHQAESRNQGATIRIEPADVELARLIVNHGYRSASKLFHPDAGGDPAMMVKLNGVVESLRSQLAALGAA